MKTIKRLSILSILSLVISLNADRALAQPALERLEKRLQSEPLPPPPGPPAKLAPLPLPQAGAKPQAVDERAYLGLVGDDRLERGRGVRVLETLPKGPAARGGLRAGDLIVRVHGKPVATMLDLTELLKSNRPGDRAKLMVERRGVLYELTVTLGRRPPAKDRQFRALRPVPPPEPKPPVVERVERIKRLERELAEARRRIAELEKLVKMKQ
ncbi:MAG: PDZ domain-containing protein [Planctomycetes bacterium]|nr:PDZ domain-containing protein [Planctomycetota bacterium]